MLEQLNLQAKDYINLLMMIICYFGFKTSILLNEFYSGEMPVVPIVVLISVGIPIILALMLLAKIYWIIDQNDNWA